MPLLPALMLRTSLSKLTRMKMNVRYYLKEEKSDRFNKILFCKDKEQQCKDRDIWPGCHIIPSSVKHNEIDIQCREERFTGLTDPILGRIIFWTSKQSI